MKKLFILVLAFTLLMGISASAVTVPSYGEGDQTSVKIDKIYEKIGAVATTPGETFKFTIANESVTDSLYDKDTMPSFSSDTFTIAIAEGYTSGTTPINLPDYDKVGIFTYKITETPGNTAGVTYDEVLFLTVYVTTDGEGNLIRKVTKLYKEKDDDGLITDDIKVENFTNEFSAGSLSVSKVVTGNMGEVDREFDVTVTFTAPAGKIVRAPVTYSGRKYTNEPVTFDANNIATVTLQLKHEDTVTFKNLPYGVTYTVVEDDYTIAPYFYSTPAYDFSDTDEVKIIDDELDTVEITNNKTVTVETGINLDSLPYLILLAIAIAGLTLYLARKRRVVNN